MELVVDNRRAIPCLKQMTIAWCFMLLLIITMDLLSFLGLLPFPGGYTFPVIAFVYFTLGPQVCSILSSLGSCLTPAFLFILLNVMIIAILLSSGCLASLTKEDMSSLLPVATSQVDVEDKVPIAKYRTGKGKAGKRFKRQFSAPPALEQQKAETELPDLVASDSSEPDEEISKQVDQWHAHTSSLIIMELPSDHPAAAMAENPKAHGMGLYNNHLMTCDQDVFNEIIGNYIDKFKQDMRKQELKGQLLTSSYSAKW